MADKIRLLPDHIANQIAAGEVVHRPASVVKETMENAIDAGATSITVHAQNGGKSLLQIIDNGQGMSYSDARRCFENHATSKIQSIEDIYSIYTMGFRGEALASIAAVAQVELKTKRAQDELGTRVRIESSEVMEHEACAHPDGTSLAVKNLFFNIPARRNFLKSNNYENTLIAEEFKRIALSHPDLSLELHLEGKCELRLRPAPLKQRIADVFKHINAGQLVPMEEATENLVVHGFIGKADTAQKTRGKQYVFVNKRFVKSNYLNHAIYKAYEEIIPKEHFPLFVLFIDINPEKIDVNVHPQKQEIKFEDERLVYTFLNAGARHALAQFSVTPSLDFSMDPGLNNLDSFKSSFSGDTISGKSIVIHNESGLNFPKTKPMSFKPDSNWQQLYEQGSHQKTIQRPSETVSDSFNFGEAAGQPKTIAIQVLNRYIATQLKSGLVLIDQQSAHERVLYERFKREAKQGNISAQKLLFPETIDLAFDEAVLLRGALDDIRQLGFEMEEFGQNAFVVHALPADLANKSLGPMMDEILDAYKRNIEVEQLSAQDSMLRAMAVSSAIKSGKAIDEVEMLALVEGLFACENPYTSPNGRPTFIKFDEAELQQRFEKL